MMIRQMLTSDVDAVYRIACISLDEEYIREVFCYFIAGWPSGQLVATDEFGNAVGFLTGARLTKDKATISLLAVAPGHRGKGVGRRLVEEFKLRAMMDGKQFIQLETRETDPGAVSFYEKMGFAPVAYIQDFYHDGCTAVRLLSSVRRNS